MPRLFLLAFLLALMVTASVGSWVVADEKDTLSDLKALLGARRNYTVPEGGVEELVSFLKSVKLNQPRTDAEFFQMQRALRTAADRVLKLEPNPKSPIHQSALQDSLFSGARLMGTLKADEQRTELDRLTTHMATAPLDRIDYTIAKTAAQELERAGNLELAATAYQTFAHRFTHARDPQIQSSAKMLGGAARRMNLVGKPLDLTGTKANGEPFDLASLHGKVVLVEFWATWCPGCRAEFPKFKKSHEKFRAQGFEVVGVSVDEDRDELDKYLGDTDVPWITLHEKEADGNHPALQTYGIFSFPSTFLIGRDGKVIALRVRGDELDGLLEKALASE